MMVLVGGGWDLFDYSSLCRFFISEELHNFVRFREALVEVVGAGSYVGFVVENSLSMLKHKMLWTKANISFLFGFWLPRKLKIYLFFVLIILVVRLLFRSVFFCLLVFLGPSCCLSLIFWEVLICYFFEFLFFNFYVWNFLFSVREDN